MALEYSIIGATISIILGLLIVKVHTIDRPIVSFLSFLFCVVYWGAIGAGAPISGSKTETVIPSELVRSATTLYVEYKDGLYNQQLSTKEVYFYNNATLSNTIVKITRSYNLYGGETVKRTAIHMTK